MSRSSRSRHKVAAARTRKTQKQPTTAAEQEHGQGAAPDPSCFLSCHVMSCVW